MVKRSSRKDSKPTRKLMGTKDIDDALDTLDDEHKRLFPSDLPREFVICNGNDESLDQFWTQVLHITWWHMLEMRRANQVARGKQIAGELDSLAKAAEELADRFKNIDADTGAVLLPVIKRPEHPSDHVRNHARLINSVPGSLDGYARLRAVADELQNIANFCDEAKEVRSQSRENPGQKVKQNTVNQVAIEWIRQFGIPAKTIDGPFHETCIRIGKKLNFEVSERMFKQAIDNAKDI